MTIDELIGKLQGYSPGADTELVRRAYQFSAEVEVPGGKAGNSQ